jgi:hypothetical protein
LPFGLTKIKDFVRVNPDKKLLKSNFFVISALENPNAEFGLNKLLKKCTTPVSPIASSTGKNNIKTGVSKVPKPKPEKKVSKEAKKAIKHRRSMDIWCER